MKYRLKDICSITKGATGIMKADGGKYPLVALSEERRSHSEFQFDAKAVIVPLISSTGHGHASMKRVHYQEGKFALGNILCAVIPKDETQLHPKYLHLYLQQFKETLLVPLMKGAANVSLPINKLADVEIEVPSLERQLEIIALEEEAAEYKNELEERLIAQDGDVAKLRQALLKEAMQGKLTFQNQNDGNAKDLLEKIKTEKIKIGIKEKNLAEIKDNKTLFEIPNNWSWCKLSDIGESTIGIIFKPSQVGNDGIPVLRANNIQDNKIDYSNLLLVNTEVREKQIAQIGDILICVRSGSNNLIGKAAVIDRKGMSFGAFMSLYRSDYNKFIFLFMKSDLFKMQINDKKSTGINQLTQGTLNSILIPLPPIAEQNRIIKKLEQLMKLCDELQYSIQQSKIENEKLLQGALRDALKKEEIITIEN